MAKIQKLFKGDEASVFPLKTGGFSACQVEEDGILIKLNATEQGQGCVFIPIRVLDEALGAWDLL
jgi:hypothetical protein